MSRQSGFKRKDRVASTIKKAVSQILELESGDKHLRSITLTDVEVSNDLRIAKIYVSSSMGELSREETVETLKHASGFIKKSLSKKVRLKYMPQLVFEYDSSIDYGFKIDQILQGIKQSNEENNK